MADKNIVKRKKSERRHKRVRGKVFGTSERPRLTVKKSLKNVSVQVIDDVKAATLVGLSSNSKTMAGIIDSKDNKTAAAKKVGLKLAELAKEKGIHAVVFDRNRYRFHGRVKAIADGAREGGLEF
jgi:large subunit ribosomal protein L18